VPAKCFMLAGWSLSTFLDFQRSGHTTVPPSQRFDLNDTPIEENQMKRLAALERYDVLDTPKEDPFERIAALIQLVFGVETSIISMIDGHRQWYKAARGTPNASVPIEESFCRLTVDSDMAVIVPDASTDERFKDNPNVTGTAHVRFYASVPLRTPDGASIGTLCAIDSQPRDFSQRDTEVLEGLGRLVINELELRRLAATDGLTGTQTRRAFKEDARRCLARAERAGACVSAITFDLDHFKIINDTHGHAAGDRVLVAAVKATQEQLRFGDLFGRLGGEEFALLLPDADKDAALAVAEKLRVAFSTLAFPGSTPPIALSASFGVAAFRPGFDDIEGLLERADEALYDAKKAGRNRTFARPEPGAGIPLPGLRQRVLKAGTLTFDDSGSSISCTVRQLWDTGAALDVSTTAGLPDELSLAIPADGFELKGRIVGRQADRLTVEFI